MKLLSKIVCLGVCISAIHENSVLAMKCLGGSCKTGDVSTSSSEDESPTITLRRTMSATRINSTANERKQGIKNSKMVILSLQKKEEIKKQNITDSQQKIVESLDRQIDRSLHPEDHNLRNELTQLKNTNPAKLSKLAKKQNKSDPELNKNTHITLSAPVLSEQQRKKNFLKLMKDQSITVEKIATYFPENATTQDYKKLLNSTETGNNPFMIFTDMSGKYITHLKKAIQERKNEPEIQQSLIKELRQKENDYINIYQWFNNQVVADSFNWNQKNWRRNDAKQIALSHNKDHQFDGVIGIIDTRSTAIAEDRIKTFVDFSQSFEKEEEFLKKSKKESEEAKKNTARRRSKSVEEF